MQDYEFGRLLNEGFSTVARRSKKTMGGIEADIRRLVDEKGFSLKSHTVANWRRGFIPKQRELIELLVQYCTSRGCMPIDWARAFLLRANYLHSETLLEQLFPAQHVFPPPTFSAEKTDNALHSPSFDVHTSANSFPYHNLPHPDYIKFIGREEEVDWLQQKLAPGDSLGQIVLAGVGGVGKSSLALFMAHYYREHYHNLPADERFEVIVWVSAKEEILTVEGKKRSSLSTLIFHTLQDIYTAIASTLGRDDITRAIPEEQDYLVQRALSLHRTLLVIDNLDSITDERVQTFLYSLPHSTKCLITSREWVDVPVIRRLKEFTFSEAEEMITSEATSRGVRLSEMQRQQLFERTSGLALPIKLSVARIASEETFEQTIRWLGNATGDLPTYCIENQIRAACQRQETAQAVLFTCSLFDNTKGVSRDALGFIANLSPVDRDAAITLLRRLSLLNRSDEDRFWLLPMVHYYVEAQFNQALGDERLTERWLQWLLGWIEQHQTNKIDHGIDVEGGFERVQALGEEYANILKAIRWCRENKRWQALLRLAEGVWPYPDLVGLTSGLGFVSGLREILETALQAARAIPDKPAEGRLLRRLGKFFWLHGQYEKALEEYVEKSEEIALQSGDCIELGRVKDTRIAIWHSQRRLQEAEQLAEDLLKMGKDLNNAELKQLATYRLSRTKFRQNQFDEALAFLDQSEQWCTELGWSQRLVWIMYGRADIFKMQGKDDAARALLASMKNMPIIQNDTGLIVYTSDHFARLFYPEEARVWSERLKWTEAVGKMKETIHSLHKDFA